MYYVCVAWHGKAWHGKAREGDATQRNATPRMAWHGQYGNNVEAINRNRETLSFCQSGPVTRPVIRRTIQKMEVGQIGNGDMAVRTLV